ncbi:MAG: Flp family type IVb pilin [Candidatus Eremiobacteraeota bacterium]|nr:Flp family type IVb pilin [Candidatus Eremiobacteraeota bacterium]
MIRFSELFRDESGVTMVEYGVILALFAIGAIAGLSAIAHSCNTTANSTSSHMTQYEVGTPP